MKSYAERPAMSKMAVRSRQAASASDPDANTSQPAQQYRRCLARTTMARIIAYRPHQAVAE